MSKPDNQESKKSSLIVPFIQYDYDILEERANNSIYNFLKRYQDKSGLTSLDLSNNHIYYNEKLLKYINESFPNLTEIIFKSAEFRPEELQVISTMTKLKSLTIKDSFLEKHKSANLEWIRNLKQLQRLDLSVSMRAAMVDIEPLSSLTELEDLNLLGCYFPDPAPIGNLTKLKHLNLSFCNPQIQNPSFLIHLTKLRSLYLIRSDIKDLSFLCNMQHLQELALNIYYPNREIRQLNFKSREKIRQFMLEKGLISGEEYKKEQEDKTAIFMDKMDEILIPAFSTLKSESKLATLLNDLGADSKTVSKVIKYIEEKNTVTVKDVITEEVIPKKTTGQKDSDKRADNLTKRLERFKNDKKDKKKEEIPKPTILLQEKSPITEEGQKTR